jgi:periplasmic divalent cation tolerance protein
MRSDYLVIVTTFPTRERAQSAAAELVRRKLVACAQVGGPINSHYRWQGVLETSEEWTCTLKTRADRYDAVAAAITELHPYETPEILATPVVAGAEKYLRWIDQSLDGK